MSPLAGLFRRDGTPAVLRRTVRGTGPGAPREEPPLEDRASGLRLAFDGRLDDREGLRRDLAQAGHDPGEGPDAALALRALAAFGPGGGAARLCGDFAFLLWDGRRRALVAGRDPLGVRPLLWHDDGRRVAFATEAAALVEGAGVDCVPDEGVAAEILAGGPRSRAGHLVRGIRRVLPGTLLEITAERVEERTFRTIDPGRVWLPRDDRGCVEALRDALREAVRCRLRDAGPAAICLSGGLDSGAVAVLAGEVLRRSGAPAPDLRAFTVSYPGLPCDETAFARETAAAAGVPLEAVPWAEPGPGRFAEESRRTRDLPDSPPSASLDGMADRIRGWGAAIVLDGEGGDECFAPSPFLVADRLGAAGLGAAWREARRWGGGGGGALRVLGESGVRPFLPPAFRSGVRRLRPGAPLPAWVDPAFARRVGLADRLRAAPPPRGPGGFARAAAVESLLGGAALRARESLHRWGARCGAEARHPFLDLRVVETSLALPHRLRSPEGDAKAALRRALEGLLPDRVRLRRDKAEFTPVVLAALRAAGMLDRPRLPRLEEAGWIDGAALAEAARDLEARRGRGDPGAAAAVAALLAARDLETWLEEAAGVAALRPAR